MLEVEEGEEPGWYWSGRGDVLVDVLPDRDWLPDVDWLSDADWLLGADWLPGTDWLCPEGDIGEVCGGQVTEGSTTRLPWSSKMALAILRTFQYRRSGIRGQSLTFHIRKTLRSC